MQSGGGPLSLTAHAYPLGEPTYTPYPGFVGWACSEANFLNLTRVSQVATYLGQFSQTVQEYGDPSQTRMVLEETASNSMVRVVGECLNRVFCICVRLRLRETTRYVFFI